MAVKLGPTGLEGFSIVSNRRYYEALEGTFIGLFSV